MAVYKSTRCYPFLNSIDIRVTQENGGQEIPAQYLKCKVETSNKKITGYRIRLLDENNNQIFPENGEHISPISELQTNNMSDIYEANGINSGLNGTYLYIPFFQNQAVPMTYSYNALYYSPQFSVSHIIMSQGVRDAYEQLTGTTVDLDGANLLSNWESVTGTSNLRYTWANKEKYDDEEKNRITLDGECLLEGEIVLCATTDFGYAVFYQAVKIQVGNEERYETQLQPLEGGWSSVVTAPNNISNILVKNGENFHNTLWTSNYNAHSVLPTDSVAFSYLTTNATQGEKNWVSFSKIGSDDSLFKWEVVLYQGDGEVVNIADVEHVDYSELKEKFYDIPVTYGTILGSNSDRIQIAYGQAFGPNGVVNTEATLPGLNTGTLVLQGTYMAMANAEEEGIFADNRLYVQSYDSSFGHVYPISGDLSATRVDVCSQAQFFKYTNDPDYIKETDTVEYGYGGSVLLYLCSSDNPAVGLNLAGFEAVSPSKRRYGLVKKTPGLVPDLFGLPSAISNLTGGKLLLTGVGKAGYLPSYYLPCENGVYQVYTDENLDSLLPEGTEVIWLKRAASYNTWADYLGKVIYCPQFYEEANSSPKAVNKESLAGSGSYTLWDPDSMIMGYSNLYFSNERPILLFENKIDTLYSFDLQWNGARSDFEVGDAVPELIDGIAPQNGFVVIGPGSVNGKAKALKVDGSVFKEYISEENFDNSLFYYVSQGEKYGKMVFKGSTSYMDAGDVFTNTPNWDLYTAQILKNSSTYTYITPFLNVEKGMKMKLSGDRKVIINSSDIETSWISIDNVNSVLNCVYHPRIKQPLVSEISEKEDTPWKYEIKSFFKASDENPFYTCEAPYLILYKNNEQYSSLSNAVTLAQYWVQDENIPSIIAQQFNVENETDLTPEVFCFRTFGDGAYIYDKAVKLSAEYIQFKGVSWESYRWCLFSGSGELLQDTGKKYDKSIAVIFHGLASDSSESGSVYYAALEVEDERQNTLLYIIKLEVRSNEAAIPGTFFKANFECDTCAVRLEFNDGSNIGNNATLYRREYEVYERPGIRTYGYYVSAIQKFYKDSEHTIEIDPQQGMIYVDKENDNDYYYEYNFNTNEYIMTPRVRIFKGEWEPVILKTSLTSLYDYNIESGKSYQYILYPNDVIDFDVEEEVSDLNRVTQIYANGSTEDDKVWVEDPLYPGQGKLQPGSSESSAFRGAPVSVGWDYWSICELVPQETDEIVPSVKRKYEVNTEQIWLFKYSLDTGEQTQNISRKDIATLGTYPKMGFGNLNYVSGQVSALLGSEIVLGTREKYIERLKKSRLEPLSTNEKTEMLRAWRNFVYSKNPKLLRDIKGQSWVVQITGSSNNSKNFYPNQPDTINFQWKQVESTKYASIYSALKDVYDESVSYGSPLWVPTFKNNKISHADKLTIIWKNWDGELLYIDNNVERDSEPEYKGLTPTRQDNKRYYVFSSWTPDPSGMQMKQSQTFTAQFNEFAKVTWKDWNGKVLKEELVPIGESPSAPTVSTRYDSYYYKYTFAGWSPAVRIASENIEYIATYTYEKREFFSVTFTSNTPHPSWTWTEDVPDATQAYLDKIYVPEGSILKYHWDAQTKKIVLSCNEQAIKNRVFYYNDESTSGTIVTGLVEGDNTINSNQEIGYIVTGGSTSSSQEVGPAVTYSLEVPSKLWATGCSWTIKELETGVIRQKVAENLANSGDKFTIFAEQYHRRGIVVYNSITHITELITFDGLTAGLTRKIVYYNHYDSEITDTKGRFNSNFDYGYFLPEGGLF